MKKITLIVVVLIITLFFANTAFAKLINSHSSAKTASVGLVDVKIVSKTSTFNSCPKKTVEFENPVSYVNEKIENIKPGDDVVLSYKIVNNGDIDVVLDGINITMHNDEFQNKLLLKWKLTQYVNSQPINSVASCSNALPLSEISTSVDTSSNDITIECSSADKDFCILCLTIFFDEKDTTTCEVPSETSFTISPSFRQK